MAAAACGTQMPCADTCIGTDLTISSCSHACTRVGLICPEECDKELGMYCCYDSEKVLNILTGGHRSSEGGSECRDHNN